MSANGPRNIDAGYSDPYKGMSEKLSGVVNAAAVLGLVAAFGQDIRKNSIPAEDAQNNVTVVEPILSRPAQQPGGEERDSDNEKRREIHHQVTQAFRGIFRKMAYLQHHEKDEYSAENDGDLIKWILPTQVTVDGITYSLEVQTLDCRYGLNSKPSNKCRDSYAGMSSYKEPYRIILRNAARTGTYTMAHDKVELVVHNLQDPNAQAFVAYINRTGEFIKKRGPFGTPEPEYIGYEYEFLEEKIGKLNALLQVLYDAQKAREEASKKKGKKEF
jgi:hypothetical protein